MPNESSDKPSVEYNDDDSEGEYEVDNPNDDTIREGAYNTNVPVNMMFGGYMGESRLEEEYKSN